MTFSSRISIRSGAALLVLGLCWACDVSAQSGTSWASQLVGPRAAADLEDAEVEVRLAAVRSLGVRGDARRAVTGLLEQLEREEDARVRDAILVSLRRRGDPAAITPLATHLTDWSPDERRSAIETLGAIGTEAAIRVLTEWLGAADVGDDAVVALTVIGAEAVPHLLTALPVPVLSARAARALGGIGDARATPSLVHGLDGALPAARVAMIEALSAIRDERATPAIGRLLTDPSPEVVAAALHALETLGGAEHAQSVAQMADRGTSAQRAAAIRALIVIDPVSASGRVETLLSDEDAPALLRRAALEGIAQFPHDAFIPTLVARLDDPDTAQLAAEGLSRVPGGTGLEPLLSRAQSDDRSDDTRPFSVAIALTLRRWAPELRGSRATAARRHLREDDTIRGRVLSALALDSGIVGALVAGLDAIRPEDRAHAALGLWLLGDADAAPAIASHIIEETDAATFRVLAVAGVRLRAEVDPARLTSYWWDPATAPEALWLTAHNLGSAARRTRRRARRAMRRSLRAPQARVRAGAALALALAGERSAWRALVAALEDDHDAVRLAAARALASLAVPAASGALAARRRVEHDPRIRATLIDGERATGHPGRRVSSPSFRVGRDVLYARVITAPGLSRPNESLIVDVILPDGRWMRLTALDNGDVLVPDLPAGDAEVQVRLGR